MGQVAHVLPKAFHMDDERRRTAIQPVEQEAPPDTAKACSPAACPRLFSGHAIRALVPAVPESYRISRPHPNTHGASARWFRNQRNYIQLLFWRI